MPGDKFTGRIELSIYPNADVPTQCHSDNWVIPGIFFLELSPCFAIIRLWILGITPPPLFRNHRQPVEGDNFKNPSDNYFSIRSRIAIEPWSRQGTVPIPQYLSSSILQNFQILLVFDGFWKVFGALVMRNRTLVSIYFLKDIWILKPTLAIPWREWALQSTIILGIA